MSDELLPISVRLVRQDDIPFIMSTWLQSYRRSSEFARHIIAPVYFAFHRKVVEGILARMTTRVQVAVDPEASEVIYGYIVTEWPALETFSVFGLEPRGVVHYVYVKEAFQNMRVATRLIEASCIDPKRCYVTHLTRDKRDSAKSSPTCGEVKWRGAESLLRRYPLARTERIADPKTHRTQSVVHHEGNIYAPHFV